MDTQKKKLKPLHTANFLITLAQENNVNITPMQLIKMTYFCYAWALCKINTEIFSEQIEAWKFGPVIPSLYHEFKRYGAEPITNYGMLVEYNENDAVTDVDVPILTQEHKDIAEIANKVFEKYKNYTATELSDLTHQEGSPWSRARQTGVYNAPLDKDDIRDRCSGIVE